MKKGRSGVFLLVFILILLQTEEVFASETVNMVSADNASDILSVSDQQTVSADILSLNAVSLDTAATDTVSDDAVSTDGADDRAEQQTDSEVSEELFETVDGLSGLTQGVDYADDQAYFTADSEEKAAEVAEDYGAELDSYAYGVAVLKFDSDRPLTDTLTAVAESCSADTAVHPDFIKSTEAVSAPDDPYYSYQWFHDPVNDLEAWNTSEGSGVTVAVLDTGICLSHPDLKGNIAGSENVVNTGSSAEDDNGHGSNVAGIIAATADNSTGVAGIAPEAKIYAIKVADADGTLTTSSSIRGIRAAIAAGADIINMSYGSTGAASYSKDEQAAINEAVAAGITVVAAAGNGTDNNGTATSTVNYPAAYDNVIAAAAYQSDNTLAYFSNYGSWVDIAAPGVRMLSCYKNSRYVYESGTSQASPSVAAVCALIYAARPALISANDSSAVSTVTSILRQTKNSTSYSYGSHSVTGGVDAAAAVALAAGSSGSVSSDDSSDDTTEPANTDAMSLQITVPESLQKIKMATAQTASTETLYTECQIKVTSDSDAGFSYTSSNRKAATVDSSGLITAAGKGTSVITVMTLDGTRKKTKIKVTVIAPVTNITYKLSNGLTGTTSPIGTGCSIKITAKARSVNSTAASNSSLVWSIMSGSGVTVKNGLVKCDKYTSSGTVVVSCVPKDGYSLASEQFTFTVYPKTTGMTVNQDGTYSSSAKIDAEVGDTVWFSKYAGEITVTPEEAYSGDFLWTVSKSSRYEITYDSSGEPVAVTVKNKGSIPVYARAVDGSGKKVKFIIKAV